jgi:ribonuclease P protein component
VLERDRLGVSVAFANDPLERGHTKVAAMERLKRRSDFRAVAQAAGAGARAHANAFILQARPRAEGGPPRVGFTVSKQVGNAVERNLVRRRLRELIRLAPRAALSAGHDYVLIGRRAALKAAFDAMMKELGGALRRVHSSGKHGSSKSAAGKSGSSKSGGGTGASGALSPHRAGRSKGGGGKRQMGRQNRASQHEH